LRGRAITFNNTHIALGRIKMNYSGIIMVVLTIFVMALQGCATPARQIAVPMGLEDQAQVPGFADMRYRIGVGTMAQVFLYPPSINVKELERGDDTVV